MCHSTDVYTGDYLGIKALVSQSAVPLWDNKVVQNVTNTFVLYIRERIADAEHAGQKRLDYTQLVIPSLNLEFWRNGSKFDFQNILYLI